MVEARQGSALVPTVELAGLEIAAVTSDEAVEAVLALTDSDRPRVVVTPNVDHVVMLREDDEFAAVYRSASLRFADGAPIVALARLVGTPLPERVTGIDLTIALLAACERDGRSVYFFGGLPSHLERATKRVRSQYPELDIAGTASPTIDLDVPTEDELLALADCRARNPDLVFAFLGAPKQEKWFARRGDQLPPAVVLCVGGTVDFLAGARRRAPGLIQAMGCEWAWRLAQEPRRLFRRYLIRDSQFVVIAIRAYVEARSRRRRARHDDGDTRR
jgi:N-acetylglucosaminyldiphosphoundecaprenol N-acetyl-beta-D-mannosaminyltransferase